MSRITDTSYVLSTRELSCQDRVTAALRQAEHPLSLREVCAHAGTRLTVRPHWPMRHRQGCGQVWELVGCDGVDDLIGESLEVDRWGYLFLVRLEAFGFVRRSPSSGGGPVWWWVAGRREWDSECEALDELIEATS